jgi:Mor family transcriptional regulator
MSTVNATSDSNPAKRTKVDEALASAIRADYVSGNFTQAELASKHGVSLPTVNRVVKGSKPAKRKYTHRDSKFSDRNASVVQKWQAGASTRDLATEFNVTHQNISLILKKAGHNPVGVHRERLTVRAAARAERIGAAKAAKKAGKMEKVNALSALWKSGAKIGEIREAAGLKSDNAAQVKIVLLRRKYPDLFPKRPAFGRTALQTAEGQAERLAKVEKLSAAWNAGKSAAECAAEVGWLPGTFTRTLPHLRKEFGVEKFAYRRQPSVKAADTVTEVEDFKAPVE